MYSLVLNERDGAKSTDNKGVRNRMEVWGGFGRTVTILHHCLDAICDSVVGAFHHDILGRPKVSRWGRQAVAWDVGQQTSFDASKGLSANSHKHPHRLPIDLRCLGSAGSCLGAWWPGGMPHFRPPSAVRHSGSPLRVKPRPPGEVSLTTAQTQRALVRKIETRPPAL